jgi:hypothetical protein
MIEEHLYPAVLADEEGIVAIDPTRSTKRSEQRPDAARQAGLVAAHVELE